MPPLTVFYGHTVQMQRTDSHFAVFLSNRHCVPAATLVRGQSIWQNREGESGDKANDKTGKVNVEKANDCKYFCC